jgi:DNA-directed RNA polymerase specialized sigma subunit
MFGDDYNEDETLLLILIKDYINELPPRRKAIISLIASGYTQEETANILGISRTSVGDIYRDTIRTMQNRLKKD